MSSVPATLHRRLVPMLFAAAVLSQACSDGTTAVTPTITVALTVTTASVLQGGSILIPVTVTGAGGFAANPAVTITGMPAGVTATVSTITTALSLPHTQRD